MNATKKKTFRGTKPKLPITAGKWPYTIGVELTWVAAFVPQAFASMPLNYSSCDSFDRRLAGRMRGEGEGDGETSAPEMNRIATDCGCVEVSTLPLQSWAKFSAAAKYYDRIAKQHGYGHTAAHCAGGGSHIHVGLQSTKDAKHPKDLWKWAWLDMIGRPYITRAFSYFADSTNAMPLCHAKTPAVTVAQRQAAYDEVLREYQDYVAKSHRLRKKGECISDYNYCMRLARRTAEDYRYRYIDAKLRLARARKEPTLTQEIATYNSLGYNDSKNLVLRKTQYGKDGTLEFRCFRAADKVAEYELHIAFVLAYMEKVKAQRGDGDLSKLYTPEYMGPANAEQDKQYFRELVAELGLPVDRYEPYCDNIDRRWQHWNEVKIQAHY